jgi:hypothetical protein
MSVSYLNVQFGLCFFKALFFFLSIETKFPLSWADIFSLFFF